MAAIRSVYIRGGILSAPTRHLAIVAGIRSLINHVCELAPTADDGHGNWRTWTGENTSCEITCVGVSELSRALPRAFLISSRPSVKDLAAILAYVFSDGGNFRLE